MSQPIFRLPPYRVEQVFTSLDAGDRIDWGLSLLNIPDQWKRSQGEHVRVAVLDTGCDSSHPDLADAIVGMRDFSGSLSGTSDPQGHGTHCAGIIAARKNDTGVVGVAPMAKLLIGKVLGDDGSGQGDWVAAGVDWAVSQDADIISMSLGSPQPDGRILVSIQRAVAKGVLVICAAGNEGSAAGQNRVGYPGRYRETIAVAAFDKQRRLAPFSSQGPEVDIAAPGVQITSTFPQSKGGFASLSGTSMATPFVSGVVALMIASRRDASADPIKDVDQLRDILSKTADDAGPAGRDWGYGFGLVDPAELLSEVPQGQQQDDFGEQIAKLALRLSGHKVESVQGYRGAWK